jgi:single-strand DNA-binding protein
MLNVVAVNGRLSRDPWINEEKGFGYLDVAVQRNFKNKKTGRYDSDFLNFLIRGKTLDFAKKYLKTGSCVDVVGSVRSKIDKDKKSITYLVANSVEFAAVPSNTSAGKNNQQTLQQAPAKSQPAKQAAPSDNDVYDDDEDLPF